MFVCIIIFGLGAIWLAFLPRISYIFILCVLFYCAKVCLFFCAESTIGDIPESTMTSAWRRSLPPLCPSSPSCPSPTSWCILPTPSVRVQRRPVVVPGCHERLSSSSIRERSSLLSTMPWDLELEFRLAFWFIIVSHFFYSPLTEQERVWSQK